MNTYENLSESHRVSRPGCVQSPPLSATIYVAVLGGQLCQLLLAKHNGDTSASFRDVSYVAGCQMICLICHLQDVRQFGLAMKKDNPGLRDQLMYNQASLQTVVDNGKDVGFRKHSESIAG